MSWWHGMRERVATFFAGDRRERELHDEMAYHLEIEVQRLTSQGLAPADARRRAVSKFGNPLQVADATRDARGGSWPGELVQDLRWAARSLSRSPGFTLTSAGVLALAIGATTAVFSVVNAVLLRPLPYAHPGRLVAVSSVHQRAGGVPTDVPVVALTDVERWRLAEPRSLASIGAFAYTEIPIRVGDQAFAPVTALVDPELLPTLGVPLARGTHFTRSPSAPGAIISHRLWQQAFAGAESALGSTISVDGMPVVVRAILPATFQFPRADASYFTKPVDVLLEPSLVPGFPADSRQWFGIARLRDHVTVADATTDMRQIARALAGEDAKLREWSVSLTSLADATTKGSRTALLIVLTIAVVLLAIAASNVMNLQFSRSAAALQAMVIRRAMGCSSARLVRQLVLENALLALGAAVVGTALAAIAARAIVAYSPTYLPVTGTIGLDERVVTFTFAVCAMTAVIAGLLPALYSARTSEQAVRAGGARTTSGKGFGRLQRGVCVAQIALGISLLSASGALVREMSRLNAIDPGFRTDSVLGFSVSVPSDRSVAQRTQYYQSALDEVRDIPGVLSAGLISFLPPETRAGVFMGISVEGVRESGGRPFSANHLVTSPGYFETMGMDVIDGRAFTGSDRENAPLVIVVNQAFVKRFYPDGKALGRSVGIAFGGGALREIVGIVRDARDRGVNRQPIPTAYIPFRQFALPYAAIVARTQSLPAVVIPEVRRRLQRLDASVPLVAPSCVAG
jgi:predicted permease